MNITAERSAITITIELSEKEARVIRRATGDLRPSTDEGTALFPLFNQLDDVLNELDGVESYDPESESYE